MPFPGPSLLNLGDDLCRRCIESSTDPEQGIDRRRFLVVLEHADVGPVEPQAKG